MWCGALVLSFVVAAAAPAGADSQRAALDWQRAPLDWQREHGLTIELESGFGGLGVATSDPTRDASGAGVFLAAGAGVFIEPGTSVTLRVNSLTRVGPGGSLSVAYVGPSLRRRIDEFFWVRAGLGLALALERIPGGAQLGHAMDFGLGHTFTPGTEHALSVALSGILGSCGDRMAAGYGLVVGYTWL